MKSIFAFRTIGIALIAFGWLVAGPGLRSADAQPVECPGNSCDVTVTATGNPPVIEVSAKELKMEKNKRDVMITWKLVNSPDYEFRSDSIKPYMGPTVPEKPATTQAAWDAQIEPKMSIAKQIKVKNKNSVRGTLAYNVMVCRPGTAKCWTLDPTIINDP